MSNTTFNRVLAGAEDLLNVRTTATVNQTRDTSVGLAQTVPVTPVNSSSLKLSEATAAALGLSNPTTTNYTIHDGLVQAATGGSLPDASSSAKGVVLLTVNPVSPSSPIAVGENDPRVGRIPTVSQDAGLDAAQGLPGNTVGFTDPSSANPYVTQRTIDDEYTYGTGRDGKYAIGAIANPGSQTISGLAAVSNSQGLIPSATYYYKFSYFNPSGETLVNSTSASILVPAGTYYVSGTIPSGSLTGATGRKIYRSTDNINFSLVKIIGNVIDTTFVDNCPITGASAPASNTTSSSWTASGEWHFDGDMTLGNVTVDNTGNKAGVLIIRCRGVVTLNGVINGTGMGYYIGDTGNNGTSKRQLNPLSSTGGTGGGAYGASGGVPGAGGSPGAFVCIYSYGIIANNSLQLNCNGSNGQNAVTLGTGSYGGAGGGGGGAGGTIYFYARDFVSIGSSSIISVAGGNGGNGLGLVGTNTGSGGGGGGGGYIYINSPVIKNLATLVITGGSGGTSSGTSGFPGVGGNGGDNYGNGGNGSVGTASGASGNTGVLLINQNQSAFQFNAVPFAWS